MDEDTLSPGQTDVPVATDTTADQASEADVQTNNEAPEATQQTEESVEVKVEDTAENKLYAGKYKSPEDMEKAYKELESKFGQTASEKAELARILNDAFASPEPTAQAPVVEDVFGESPDPVVQEIENLKRQTAVQGFIMNHQDADAAVMGKILAEDPLVKQIAGHEAKLEYAYLRSQSMSQPKAIEEAKKTAQTQAQAKIVEKQAAQVESVKTSEQTNETAELFEKATGNYSQEERDAARRALIRKNLVNL